MLKATLRGLEADQGLLETIAKSLTKVGVAELTIPWFLLGDDGNSNWNGMYVPSGSRPCDPG